MMDLLSSIFSLYRDRADWFAGLLADHIMLALSAIAMSLSLIHILLDGETISQWLYDDGSQVIISDEGAAEYVQTPVSYTHLNCRRNTAAG